jgi:4-diphosphocytidyl-2C-methyl-D-erythritol kinase
VSFKIQATETYTVTGTDNNGCTNTESVTVIMNALPLVKANATSLELCNGASVILSGSGATTYTWDNGVSNGVSFAPTSTKKYTVTGTDDNGCQQVDYVTVVVNELPIVVANSTSTEICNGESVTLTGSGAVSYVWDNSATNGVAIIPTSTTTYSVEGTDAKGCKNVATI